MRTTDAKFHRQLGQYHNRDVQRLPLRIDQISMCRSPWFRLDQLAGLFDVPYQVVYAARHRLGKFAEVEVD